MTTSYLTCAETAKLVRQALKEAFPDVRFSVKSKTYIGGASITVRWADGPNAKQVDAVTGCFEGSYFDGSIDYKGNVYHMLDGQSVRFGADSIHTNREHSDKAVNKAIDALCRRYGAQMREQGIERPTAEDFQRGRLWSVRIGNWHHDVQGMLYEILARQSDRLAGKPSALVARVFVTHDDGYSRRFEREWVTEVGG